MAAENADGVWQAGKMMTKREAARTGWCSQNGQRQPLAATVPKRAVAATVPKRAVAATVPKRAVAATVPKRAEAATASAFVRLPIKGFSRFSARVRFGALTKRLPILQESSSRVWVKLNQ